MTGWVFVLGEPDTAIMEWGYLMEGIEAFKGFFQWLAGYDLWSFASFLVLVIGIIAGYWKFYRPRKSIQNFLVHFHCERAPGWNFPLRILVRFTNHTGRSVHISSANFKGKRLRPDPKSSVDLSTGKIPLKFPREFEINGEKETLLHDFEYYLEIDAEVGSYAPIDPTHTDEELEEAFRRGKVGTLDCYITILSRDLKPIVHRLKVRPKIQLAIRYSPKEEAQESGVGDREEDE